MRIIRLLLALGLPAWAGAAEIPAGPVPVELLFVNHESSQMQVSPDGKYLASIFVREKEKPLKRWTALAAFCIDDRKPVPLLDLENVNVLDFWWVGGNRLLVSYWNYFGWGLFSCNPDGSEFVTLVDPEKLEYGDPRVLLYQCEVLHTQTGDPDEVLIARQTYSAWMEKRLSREFDRVESAPGAYRLNVRTGKTRLVAKDPAYTYDWIATKGARPRVAVAQPKDAFSRQGKLLDLTQAPKIEIFWINDDGTADRINEILTGEDEHFQVIGLNEDETGLLFFSRQGRDKGAVHLYRRATRTVEGPLVNGEVEASQFMRSKLDQSPAGIVFPEAKPRVHYFDARLTTMQKGIDEVLPEFVNTFISWDREMERILISSESPGEPGRYYLFDRVAGKLEMVFQRAPWLRGWKLGVTEAVSIPARDGFKMHGLLTRPPDAAAGAARPMVLLVHGGPWGIRDNYEYDPERSFYATRGYAVLQVNFRGSAGYGRAVELASFGQFGRAMQDDLNDAVAWAVAQGVADPTRVIIAGNSYGGYAALRGATRDPSLYRAVITGFAPVNMNKMFDYYKVEADDMLRYHFWARRIGDPEADAGKLRDISPVNFLHRLQVPVFVLFGDNDKVVDYGQSKELVKTLRDNRKKHIVFAPPNQREGHGFSRKENRFKAYLEIEKFLEEHVPAK